MWSLSISGVIGFAFLLANGIQAQELTAIAPPPPADHPSSFMHVFGAAEPPLGFVVFCLEEPAECSASPNGERPGRSLPRGCASLMRPTAGSINRSRPKRTLSTMGSKNIGRSRPMVRATVRIMRS